MELQIPSPLQRLPISSDYQCYIKRDDLIHPLLSGNKFRKLRGFIEDREIHKVITFGGPFSNHIHATAAYCYEHRIECELIIRGKDADPENPTLLDARKWNAQINLVDRIAYRDIKKGSIGPLNKGTIVIPEGGWGEDGILGLHSLVKELDEQIAGYDHIVLPVGTATTLIGIARYIKHPAKITGIRAVRDESLFERIEKYTHNSLADIQLVDGYEWGRFAKYDDQLLAYMDGVKSEYKIPLDFIYNAKALYAFQDLMAQGYFEKGSTIVYLHTGGLQGNRGLEYRRKS